MDFAGLLEGKPDAGIEVVRASAAPVIAGRGQGVTHPHSVAPPMRWASMRFTICALPPAGALDSEPHSPGCREHLTVIDGQVRVWSGDEDQVLGPGRYRALSGGPRRMRLPPRAARRAPF